MGKIKEHYFDQLISFPKYLDEFIDMVEESIKEDTEETIGPLEQEIRNKCAELAEFLVEKNKAYGNSVAEPLGVFARRLDTLAQIDVRIDDKLNRLSKGSEYPGDDTIKDLTGYLIMRMIVKEKNEPF